MTQINRDALRLRAKCRACHGHLLPPALRGLTDCGNCRGALLVPKTPDVTGIGFLAGSETLQDFLANGLTLLDQLRHDAGALEFGGDLDGAVIEWARRSGMAEVLVGLECYLIPRPAPARRLAVA